MNWEAVGAIGEIIGAVAVVVSILYLAAQISSNTRAIRSDAGFEATHSWATTNEICRSFTDVRPRDQYKRDRPTTDVVGTKRGTQLISGMHE